MVNYPDPTLPGSEPSKKRKTSDLNIYYDNGKIEKKPTGILKELMELKRCDIDYSKFPPNLYDFSDGRAVLWSDVEAIINKYLNP